jgi:hypothetical protein
VRARRIPSAAPPSFAPLLASAASVTAFKPGHGSYSIFSSRRRPKLLQCARSAAGAHPLSHTARALTVPSGPARGLFNEWRATAYALYYVGPNAWDCVWGVEPDASEYVMSAAAARLAVPQTVRGRVTRARLRRAVQVHTSYILSRRRLRPIAIERYARIFINGHRDPSELQLLL